MSTEQQAVENNEPTSLLAGEDNSSTGTTETGVTKDFEDNSSSYKQSGDANAQDDPVLHKDNENADLAWKNTLPDELKNDPSLKPINNIQSLAKSYIHARKMVGADKIAVPGKHATPEERRDVLHKLGLPQDPEKYDITHSKDTELDEDFLGKYKEKAYELGVFPEQAKGLLQWYEDYAKGLEEDLDKQEAQTTQESIEGLKKELGAKFEPTVKNARLALKQFADESDLEAITKDPYIANNPSVIKLLAKVSESLSEDKISEGENSTPVMTPDGAQREYQKIIGDSNHPYNVKGHPEHQRAVLEVQRLFEMAYSQSS